MEACLYTCNYTTECITLHVDIIIYLFHHNYFSLALPLPDYPLISSKAAYGTTLIIIILIIIILIMYCNLPPGDVQLTLYLKLVHSLDYAPVKPNPFIIIPSLWLMISSWLHPQVPFQSDKVMPMEYLPVNDDAGQGFGYIMYRTTIPSTSEKVTISSLNDMGVVSDLQYYIHPHILIILFVYFFSNYKFMIFDSNRFPLSSISCLKECYVLFTGSI